MVVVRTLGDALEVQSASLVAGKSYFAVNKEPPLFHIASHRKLMGLIIERSNGNRCEPKFMNVTGEQVRSLQLS